MHGPGIDPLWLLYATPGGRHHRGADQHGARQVGRVGVGRVGARGLPGAPLYGARQRAGGGLRPPRRLTSEGATIAQCCIVAT